INDFAFQENNYISQLKETFTAPELIFPSIQAGGNELLPTRTRQNRVQVRDNISLIAGAHSLKFGGEYQRIDLDFSLDLFGRGAVFFDEDFASLDRNGDGLINDNDLLVGFTLQGFTPQRVVPYDNDYVAFYIQDDWKIRPNLTLNLGLRYEVETDSKNTSSVNSIPAIVQPLRSGRRRERDTDNFGPRIGINWSPFKNNRTSVHASYGIFYDRIVINTRDLEKRTVLIAARLGSVVDDDGNFLPGSPTLSNPFIGELIPEDQGGFFLLDDQLENPIVQQFNFGIRHELFRDLIISVDGVHNFGTKFILAQPLGTVFNPAIGGPSSVINVAPSAKNWYDGLLVNVEKRPTNGFGFIASYTLSKAFNYSNDDQFIVAAFLPVDPENLRGEKGHAQTDQRHRFTFAGIFDLPLGFTVSPIFTVASDLPFDIFVPDGSTRIPFLQRNAGGRQFRTGRELNAFINQINAGGGLTDIGLLPLVRDDLKFGDGFSSFDLRVTKSFPINERVKVQAIAEVFNLFNVTNIRGFSNFAFSGFQNVLVRDSNDPNDPGFLRSSAFGTKLQTAGGVFGTGGPRAFQFALRVNF
ncbi:MAG: TonB-dependent receptor, partial [Acidobacteriota bacterium]